MAFLDTDTKAEALAKLQTLETDVAGKSPTAGSTSLTTLGTITTGTWTGSTIAVANGGTGATTAAGARTSLGLGNVENTALSTWTGSAAITTLGTIATGTWQGSVIGPAYLGTGTSITTKYLRGDGTWQTISGGGDALTSGNLSQFAATTSAQLASVISDETGTGALVFAGSPALTGTPTAPTATTGTDTTQVATTAFVQQEIAGLGTVVTVSDPGANRYQIWDESTNLPALSANPAIPSNAISASDIDWNASQTHSKTLSANTTFTFSNATDGQMILVAITNTASNYTVTWPTVDWGSAGAPTQRTGAVTDVYTFTKIGSTIYGSVRQ